MKKIMVIDGGPRKTMNTAALLEKVAEGIASAGKDIEVKHVRLYDLNYKGCMSCMACKLKGKASNVCKFRDALTPRSAAAGEWPMMPPRTSTSRCSR